MVSEHFAFKQFRISQKKCAMKVGTDAVLLGAWADISGAKSILDIGTGSGVIALMMAQRCNARIDAIDIDQNSCEEAQRNFSESKWKERVNIYQEAFQNWSQKPGLKYDLIISNPPYFIGSSKASHIERTLARHTDQLSFGELIDGVAGLLHDCGKFCVILPSKEGEMFRDMARMKKLHLTKLTRVRTTPEKVTNKRLLMQFEKQPTCFKEDTLVIEQNARHSYTEEYKKLTKEFYLHF